VQRIPVKIALDDTAIELRPGMSVIPTIATRSQPEVHQAAPQRSTIKPAYTLARR